MASATEPITSTDLAHGTPADVTSTNVTGLDHRVAVSDALLVTRRRWSGHHVR
jgi:hypothetical protein